MTNYLEYSRYKELGGTLNEIQFTHAEFRARMFIDAKTFNRLSEFADDDPIWEKVEMLMFALISGNHLGQLNGRETQSESNSKISVTYKDTSGKALELIKMYLPEFFQGGIIQGKVLRV